MQTEMLWAGVRFSALGGRTEALLQASADRHLRLRGIVACPGGFRARCGAQHYLALAHLARRYHVRLHLLRRCGLYFSLRHTLRRAGLWVGLVGFGLMILASQHLIWNISYVDLTIGQQARIAAALRECGLEQGAYVRPEMLTQGETALIEGSGEFGWASLNFEDGRLTVEAAPAEPVPTIEPLRYTDLCARASGTVLSLDVERGTPAVVPGQIVVAGQVLIAVNRTDRAGNPVAGCAAGSVQARLSWNYSAEQPLSYEAQIPQGRVESSWQFLCLNRELVLPPEQNAQPTDGERTRQRHGALSVLGLTLPVAWCETEHIPCETQTVTLTESLALAKARLAAKRALVQEWPDAQTVAVEEKYEVADDILQYSVTQTIDADLCDHGTTEK